MIARLLFILYKQEDHVIPKHYYKISRLIFCLSYFIAIITLSKTVSNPNDIHFNLTQIIILFFTTIAIPADILDHTGREENILLKNLEYTFISKQSQSKVIYDASKNLEFITFHDIASSESVYTMISYKLEEIQDIQKFKVLKSNKKYNQSDTYYIGQNHIDDESKNQYEIERIEVYDAKVKTTVFKRKTVKTVKMIDFYWKGKDK